MTSTLPSITSFVSQTQTSESTFSLSGSATSVSDTISTLPSGASASFSILALVPSSASSGTGLSDSASASTTTFSILGASIMQASRVQTQANLGVALTGSSTALAGSDVTYILAISNAGPNTATSVTLADTLPTGTTFVSQSQTSGPAFTLSNSGNAVSDTLSSLSAGSSAVIDSVAAINTSVSNGTALTNTATVSSTVTDPETTNNSSSVSVTNYTTSPVTITNPGTQNSTEGSTISLAISASDATGGTLSYAAEGLPPGLLMNASTGDISGTLPVGAAANGPYTPTLTVTDGTWSASTLFTWNVASPVVLTNPGPQTTTENTAVTLDLSATDSCGGSVMYGASGLPAGLKISPSSGAVTGTVAVGAAASGPDTVTVTAGDGTYSASQTFTWTINPPITLAQPADQTNVEGDTVSLALSATDSTSGTLSYAAAGLPYNLKISTTSGVISGIVAPGDAATGSFSVTVVASDGTYSASKSFNWTITSPITLTAPADQTSNEGATLSLTVSASDSSGGTPTFSAVGLPNGLAINATTGVVSGTVTVGAAAAGPYTVTVVAEDGT